MPRYRTVTSPDRVPVESDAEAAPGHEGGGTAESGPLVALVVPTYNEAENLPVLARRIFGLNIPNTRLIVVDDGSPDGTGDVASELARQLGGRLELIQRGRKLGLGTAYVEGFSHALAEGAAFVLQMDADLSHPPEYVPDFLRRLGEADVVVGSRYVPGGGVDEAWGVPRRFLSYAGNFGIRAITGLKVRDATSGFKAFHAGVLSSLYLTQLRSKGFAFQAELASACQRMGFNIVERPIMYSTRAKGRSKMSMSIIIEAMWRLPSLRWKRNI